MPILTVAQLIGNASRVGFNRKALDWRVVGYFAVAAVPSAFAGGYLYARAPVPWLLRAMGVFLLATVAWRWAQRRLWRTDGRRFPARGFLAVGAAFSFLSAIVGSVGPFIVPFFLAYGLVKDGFIGTEALCTVVMHVVKLAAYRETSILSLRAVEIGLVLGPLMVTGSWLGKRIVGRLSERAFTILVELTLIAAGMNFLLRG